MRVVIAAGGTAGHVVPALAVADVLRADGAEVVFVGGERAERELVPAAGYELLPIRVAPLARRDPVRAARAVSTAAAAFRHAARLLRERRPGAVMGAGGYVSGPVGLAAVARRVPLVLTEADSHLGLANRALAPFARRICLAFPLPGREPPRYIVTGRPVPPPATDRDAARARFGIGPEETVVLVFGGSLGARSINLAALDAFGGTRFRVLHVAGERDFADLESPGPNYDLRPYLDGFGEALIAADLVVARAGGSVFEIAAAGRPSVLIPYPHAAAGHQATNAAHLERAGAAVVIDDAELTSARLASVVGGLLGDRAGLAAMSRAALGFARPDAAQRIAEEVRRAAGVGAGPPA